MTDLFRSTLLKALLPALSIAIILIVTRRRGLSWRDDLGFSRPRVGALALWLAIWVAWIIASERIIDAFHLDDAAPWPAYDPIVLSLRVLAIGVLGPIAEELVMRGLFFSRVRRTAVGPFGAIAILSLAWTLMHYRYGPGTLALVFADGLLLGLARHVGGSVWIPMAMHVLGNLVSIAQSLGA